MDFQDKQDIKIPIYFILPILYIHVDDFWGLGGVWVTGRAVHPNLCWVGVNIRVETRIYRIE